jgi:hypothetical protein
VVDLLNHSFVPVYLTIDAYESAGSASAAEKAEFARVCGDISYAKKGVAFIVDPDGVLIESLISSPAITTERVVDVLESAIASIKTVPGDVLGKPIPQAPPPEAGKGGVVLHLTARYLPKDGPGWARMPAEDWIVLNKNDCEKLVPDAKAAAGHEWKLDKDLSAHLLKYFYPPSLNFYLDAGKLEKHDLKAQVVSVKGGAALVRVDGTLRMKRSFTFAKPDDLVVHADVVGFIECDPATKRIRSVNITTDKGTYAEGNFGVAVRLWMDGMPIIKGN